MKLLFNKTIRVPTSYNDSMVTFVLLCWNFFWKNKRRLDVLPSMWRKRQYTGISEGSNAYDGLHATDVQFFHLGLECRAV